MSILGRLSTLIKSNVNDAIDAMQDPGKAIDQMVLDMDQAAKEARGEVASAMAEGVRLDKRAKALEDEARVWEDKAALAVRAGDDELAKAALARKGEKEAERTEALKAKQEQDVQVEQLTSALRVLDARVKEVKLRQGTRRERARAAKKGTGLGAASGAGSAFAEFERMSSQVDAVEAEVGLSDELAGRAAERAAVDRKLDALATDKGLDDALAALKKKLDGGA